MAIDAASINDFVVLENTEKVRHMVVCTLCSCYPRMAPRHDFNTV
jgi:hypothetical protein